MTAYILHVVLSGSVVLMEMDDELQTFIREYKARLAKDKASLYQEPPYMEMKVGIRLGLVCTVDVIFFNISALSCAKQPSNGTGLEDVGGTGCIVCTSRSA